MRNTFAATLGVAAAALSLCAPLLASAWAYGPKYGYSMQGMQQPMQLGAYSSANSGHTYNYYVQPQPMYDPYPSYSSYSYPYYTLAYPQYGPSYSYVPTYIYAANYGYPYPSYTYYSPMVYTGNY